MCPYCGVDINKVPARSRLCAVCKNRIYNDGKGKVITENSYFDAICESNKESILNKIHDGLGWAVNADIKVFVQVFAKDCCEKCLRHDGKIYEPDDFVNIMPIPNRDCQRSNKHCCATVMVISERKARRDGLI